MLCILYLTQIQKSFIITVETKSLILQLNKLKKAIKK